MTKKWLGGTIKGGSSSKSKINSLANAHGSVAETVMGKIPKLGAAKQSKPSTTTLASAKHGK